MELNATFYAQLVQFMLLWAVVRSVFVRPVLRLIVAESKRLQDLTIRVESAEARVVDRTRHNEQEWELLALRLREQRPRGEVGEPSQPVEVSSLSCAEMQVHEDVDALAAELMHRVIAKGTQHD